MMDIAEISAAPHFPQALQTIVAGDRQNALSELLFALSGMHEIAVRELDGELHIACAANSNE